MCVSQKVSGFDTARNLFRHPYLAGYCDVTCAVSVRIKHQPLERRLVVQLIILRRLPHAWRRLPNERVASWKRFGFPC